MQTLEELKAAQQQTADIERQVLEDIKAKATLLGYELVRSAVPVNGITDLSSGPKPPVKAKYRDHNDNTWSGRGKRPAWVNAILEAGDDLEKYRI